MRAGRQRSREAEGGIGRGMYVHTQCASGMNSYCSVPKYKDRSNTNISIKGFYI